MTFSSILRRLPDFMGKRRMARVLLDDRVTNGRDLIVKGKYGCSYIVPNITENVGFDIFVNGIYEPETCQLLDSMLPAGGVFLDIGGNIGAVTVPLCKKRPDIKAIAIEAAPWIFPYLQQNVRDNQLLNVKLFNNAVYDQDSLLLDFFSPRDKFGKGSLNSLFTEQSQKVMTTTIDGLIRDQNLSTIDVVKVDVEGYEYFVFKGARHLLSGDHCPVIFFEFVDWAEGNAPGLAPGAAQQLLIDLGFNLSIISGRNKRTVIQSPVTRGSYNILAEK